MRWQLATAQRAAASSAEGRASEKLHGRAGAAQRRHEVSGEREEVAQGAVVQGASRVPPPRSRSPDRVQRASFARVVVPAFLAHGAARVDVGEGGPHADFEARRVGHPDARQPAVGELVEDTVPEQRGHHAAAPTWAPCRAGSSPAFTVAISSRWLTACSMPEQGAVVPGDAHGDAAQA